jgi:hypothetical protein
MINIDDFKKFVYDLANKNGRGTISPDRFNSFSERALMEWTMQQYGNQSEYQPGRPIPRVGYENTQMTIDNLRHLLEVQEVSLGSEGILIPDGVIQNALGSEVMPDYLHFSSLRTLVHYQVDGNLTTLERPVEIVSDNEFGNRQISKIVAPSPQYPIGKFEKDRIIIAPSNAAQRAKLSYLRQPNTPVWGYTLVNNRPKYDSSLSTDLDAPREAFNAIAIRVLGFLGIHLREQDLQAYSMTNKQSGI